MKKLFFVLVICCLSVSVFSQNDEIFEKKAKFFAEQAQKEFNLSDNQRGKVFQLRKQWFEDIHNILQPLRKADREKEAKYIGHYLTHEIYQNGFMELFNCTVEEFWAFNKKMNQEMKKIE